MDTRPDWDVALRHEDARMARYGRPASVMVIGLRMVPPGSADRLAARIGDIVRELARETDRVTRAAADRFHVLLPETESAEAETLLARVRQACADRVVGRLGAEVRVVGAAASPGRGETLHDALRAAQIAVGAA
jgi:GGDEF domain-containing protein